MSTTKVVRYRTKPEHADENERLIREVFAELAEHGAGSGLHYAAFRLDDGVSFLHVAVLDGEENPLTSSPAFAAFQAGIGGRCAEGPSPPMPRWSGPTGSWHRDRPALTSRVTLGAARSRWCAAAAGRVALCKVRQPTLCHPPRARRPLPDERPGRGGLFPSDGLVEMRDDDGVAESAEWRVGRFRIRNLVETDAGAAVQTDHQPGHPRSHRGYRVACSALCGHHGKSEGCRAVLLGR